MTYLVRNGSVCFQRQTWDLWRFRMIYYQKLSNINYRPGPRRLQLDSGGYETEFREHHTVPTRSPAVCERLLKASSDASDTTPPDPRTRNSYLGARNAGCTRMFRLYRGEGQIQIVVSRRFEDFRLISFRNLKPPFFVGAVLPRQRIDIG